MKKSYIYLLAVAGLLTACDPSKDDISMPGSDLTSEQLSDGFTFKQYSDETYSTEAADGNYFTFFTSPARVVRIYQKDAEGAESVLFSGAANGSFKIVPKRGNPNDQTFYVETMDFTGNKIVAEKTCNVYVPSELTPEMRLLASDAYGYKVWTWDTSTGRSWGNGQYAGNTGAEFADTEANVWWGCLPEDLTGQLNHSDTGVATGEEDSKAYMEFYDDGNIITYSGSGNQIRKGKYSVSGWNNGEYTNDPESGNPWKVGTLTTTEGTILFPFKINGGGEKPKDFDIIKLTSDQLILVYGGNGTWGEATWWRFKSSSDGEGMLTDFGNKSWTWDTSTGRSWGNGQYAGNTGAEFADTEANVWWGCLPEDLTGQLNHSDTGVATGEEDSNAYMTFDWNNSAIKSFDATGKEIRNGKFEIAWNYGKREANPESGNEWSLGTLHTDAGSILFPFQINGGGNKPTDFDVLKLTNNEMVLVYGGNGAWGEATWWRFKKK